MYGKIMQQYKIKSCSEDEIIEQPTTESIEQEIQTLELTPEQLELLMSEEPPIDIGQLLETEMVVNRTLYLSEEVTLDTVNHIIMLIHKFNRDDYEIPLEERQPIIIYFDSAGGEIYRGFSLLSTVRSSETPIIGVLMGTCMSMCLPLWLSCDVKYASRYSSILYHSLRAGADIETLPEMVNKIKHYKNLQKQLDNFILENTEIPKKKLKKKYKSNLDWFITFDEMTKYKMYDHLID